ncbi:MAG: hypothetical protein K8R90_06675 [Candidatus Cloacimonetes bacterium]|nr:hypothetical protein [Candidatus Cloacimonadota bacterium]
MYRRSVVIALVFMMCIMTALFCVESDVSNTTIRDINYPAKSLIAGVFLNPDSSMTAIVVSTQIGEQESTKELYRFDQQMKHLESTPLPLNPKAIPKGATALLSTFWFVTQIYTEDKTYLYSLVAFDSDGREIHRHALPTTDEIIGTRLRTSGDSGIAILNMADQTAIYTFTTDSIDPEPWIIDQSLDQFIPNTEAPGSYYAGRTTEESADILLLDVGNREIRLIKSIPITNPEYVGEILQHNDAFFLSIDTMVSKFITESQLYCLQADNPPVEIPIDGCVTEMFIYRDKPMIEALSNTQVGPRVYSISYFHEITESNELNLVRTLEAGGYMIPTGALLNDTIYIYGMWGHRRIGLSGFIQKIPIP